MIARSSRPEVRNPVLDMPAAVALSRLPPEAKAALRGALRDIEAEARRKAEHSWRTSKPPLALYWKMVAVYARHLRAVAGRTPA